jgi:hypothetical protein
MFGFGEEALAERSVGRKLGREHLERDLSVQPSVLGEIDLTHPASSEQAFDAIGRDLGRRRLARHVHR